MAIRQFVRSLASFVSKQSRRRAAEVRADRIWFQVRDQAALALKSDDTCYQRGWYRAFAAAMVRTASNCTLGQSAVDSAIEAETIEILVQRLINYAHPAKNSAEPTRAAA